MSEVQKEEMQLRGKGRRNIYRILSWILENDTNQMNSSCTKFTEAPLHAYQKVFLSPFLLKYSFFF
jgi:hypothetical protein